MDEEYDRYETKVGMNMNCGPSLASFTTYECCFVQSSTKINKHYRDRILTQGTNRGLTFFRILVVGDFRFGERI